MAVGRLLRVDPYGSQCVAELAVERVTERRVVETSFREHGRCACVLLECEREKQVLGLDRT